MALGTLGMQLGPRVVAPLGSRALLVEPWWSLADV